MPFRGNPFLVPDDPTTETIAQLRRGVQGWLDYHDRSVQTILAGPNRGITLLLRKRGDRQKRLGLYECEVNGFYTRWIKPGMTVYDIGAADGDTTLPFARRVGAAGCVYAFEPDDEPFGHLYRLNQNLKLNPDLAPRIEVVCRAVGNAFRLDDFPFPPSPPDFVKVDVDGQEFEVLESAHKILAVSRPVWLIEVHSQDLEDHCRATFDRADYATKVIRQAWWRPLLGLREGRPIPYNAWLAARPN